MASRSIQPRRQRRALFRAGLFHRHKRMAVALSRELRSRYGRRSLPLRKGDTVRVMAGSFRGREERIARVDLRGFSVTLDNVAVKKVDQKLKPLPIRPSHLILTKLNLSDPWRRRILKVAAAEVPEAPAEAPPVSAPAEAAPAVAAPAVPEGLPAAVPEAEASAEAAAHPPRRRRAKAKPEVTE